MASAFVIKQSLSPITDETFDAATSLCNGGVCRFERAERIELVIGDLVPGTTYHYALRGVGPDGAVGELSNPASATTAIAGATESVTDCPAPVQPAPGQLVYPGGRYSLVGLPTGSVLATLAPLYSWIDQGAGGGYRSLSGGVELEAGHGYWAWFACDGTATLGDGQSSVSMPLGGYHASMVGNPSATDAAVVSGHDFAARWDSLANEGNGAYVLSGYREPQELAVGQGTWAFAYGPTTVAINASP